MKARRNECSRTPKPARFTSAPSLTCNPYIYMQRDPVTVEKFYAEQAAALQLKLVAGTTGLKRIIREPTVNRPGLVLTGFTRYFANKRMQAIGNAEAYYLKSLAPGQRAERYATFF